MAANQTTNHRIKATLAISLMRFLSILPECLVQKLARAGGRRVDRKKGIIARAALKKAFPEQPENALDQLAEKAARNGLDYLLSIPRLHRCHYQLHNLETVRQVMAKNRGLLIAAPHMGPPDIATLALTREGIAVSTVIGAGKQKPWLNAAGQWLLDRVGIRFIQRGDPVAVMKTLRRKEALFLHCDMRSDEAPVRFFGMETRAPASLITSAIMMNVPVLFHFCTLEKGGGEQKPGHKRQWHCHFEHFDLELTGNREQDIRINLQRLFDKMETVIRQNPELWIWHYDRFQLKHLVT